MKRALAALFLLTASAFGSLSTGVSISSIGSCSNGVCTVTTASAHGIPANNPAGYITGSSVSGDNIAFAAISVPTSTTLTASGLTACASSCGTLAPAPLFVILSSSPGFGLNQVLGCIWTFTPNGIPRAGATSSCASALAAPLAAEVNSALASGQWIETTTMRTYANGAASTTIQNDFLAIQFSLQLALAAANAPGGPVGKACDVTGCN